MTATRWPEVALGEVAKIERSSVRPEAIEPGITYVGLEHMRPEGGFTELKPVDTGGLASQKFRFTADHLLYGKLRPYLSKIACPDFAGICSTDILPIRPGPHVDRRYLLHFLRQPSEVARAASLATGVNLPRLSPKALAAIPVPLPPIEEQRRIAEILDAADELRAKRRESLALLDALSESLFLDVFRLGSQTPVAVNTNLFRHPEGWAWEPLTSVARLATGHTPDRDIAHYWDGEIPWISLTEIRGLDGSIALDTNLRVTQAGIDNSSSVVLPVGTVCFSRTASIGFVTVMGRPMATSQDFVNWICGERTRPLYLMHAFLRSRRQMRALSTGSTHKTIYMRTAEQLKVLVPPLSLQDEFVAGIEALAAHQDRNRESESNLDALFASLQQRAFRGEL